jgi:hypothetical protein
MGLHKRWSHPELEPHAERKPTDAAPVAEEAEDCVNLEAKCWSEDTLEKRIVNEENIGIQIMEAHRPIPGP